MSKLSAIIIAKNGENMLVDCMESLAFCSEIILIDGGSHDRTVEIARKLGAKTFSQTDANFSELRNLGKEKAAEDWILYVDVDERVSKELSDSIKNKIKGNDKYNAYRVKRKNFYLGNNEWPYIEELERLFKKEYLESWFGELHETPKIIGSIGELDGFLLHYTHQDLTSMLNKTIAWSKIEAKLRFDSNHPKMTWWRFPRVMLTAFFNSYVTQGGWKAGTAGLIESIYQSYSMFITYATLWEMQENKNEA